METRFQKDIGSLITEVQIERVANAGHLELPKIEGIKKYYDYINNCRNDCVTAMENNPTDETFVELAETTFLSILLLNRRRSSELEICKNLKLQKRTQDI